MWEGYLSRFRNFSAENRKWLEIEINILYLQTNKDLHLSISKA